MAFPGLCSFFAHGNPLLEGVAAVSHRDFERKEQEKMNYAIISKDPLPNWPIPKLPLWPWTDWL